jgi:hypothetical protein
MRFTGGDNLTGFKKLVHQVMMQNELRNGEGAYVISHAKAGRSGYSFGPIQWDLLNNETGVEIFTDVLTNAKDLNNSLIFNSQNKNAVLNSVTSQGSSLTIEQINLVNQALSSSYGVEKINESYLVELDNAIIKIDSVINKVTNPENKAFLQTDLARLFLIDYNNQFNISPNKQMEKFLQGQTVSLKGYTTYSVDIKGNLGIEDLLNFYLHTKYGQEKPGDLVRRFSNIIETVGINSIPLTSEDKKFLMHDLTKILGKRFDSIINDKKGDNWGIKSIIAYTVTGRSDISWYSNVNWHWLDPYFVANKLLDAWKGVIISASTAMFKDPLILDLVGDGIETTNVKDGAYFDHDGNGFAEQTGWASSDDGLLVMDKNGNGVIDDGKELFGDQTILSNGQRANDGFQALAELDSNSDGIIDINDTVFPNLRIWQDIDGDGYSAEDELFTLDEMGIQSINVAYTNTNISDAQGNKQVQAGTFTKTDGSTAAIGGFSLQRDVTHTIATEWLDVPDDIAVLPDLQGYGNTYDLHQAMVRDTTGTLKFLVEQFVVETNSAIRDSLMEQILFKWTDSDNIDPGSRGGLLDARKLAVIEKLMGQAFYGASGSNPNSLAAPLLAQAYEGNLKDKRL